MLTKKHNCLIITCHKITNGWYQDDNKQQRHNTNKTEPFHWDFKPQQQNINTTLVGFHYNLQNTVKTDEQ